MDPKVLTGRPEPDGREQKQTGTDGGTKLHGHSNAPKQASWVCVVCLSSDRRILLAIRRAPGGSGELDAPTARPALPLVRRSASRAVARRSAGSMVMGE